MTPDQMAELAARLRELASLYRTFNQTGRDRSADLAAAADLIAELETHKSFADLWYFVMDEAPQEFERIVAEHQPKNWLQEAAKLRAARRGKA